MSVRTGSSTSCAIKNKKALITGANGQVGWELQRTVPDNIEIVALDRSTLDIRDQNQVNEVVSEIAPDVVINAAAYTAVDKAEVEPEDAFEINAAGAGFLARASHVHGAKFIHLSTDFIFDGAQAKPYLPDEKPNPLGVYGVSKLEGERLVMEYSHFEATIIRTSWLYSVHGDNFVKTILHLLKERDEIKVVDDQVGSPTWANGLACTIWRLNKLPETSGFYHWTDAGVASWFDFSVAIQEEALNAGILERVIPIIPVSSCDYKTLAKRPSYSALDRLRTEKILGREAVHWRESLRGFFGDYKDGDISVNSCNADRAI